MPVRCVAIREELGCQHARVENGELYIGISYSLEDLVATEMDQ